LTAATNLVPSAEDATQDQFVLGALVRTQFCPDVGARAAAKAARAKARTNRKIDFMTNTEPPPRHGKRSIANLPSSHGEQVSRTFILSSLKRELKSLSFTTGCHGEISNCSAVEIQVSNVLIFNSL